MNIVNYTEFRRNLATHLDKVVADSAELIITRRDHKSVVLVSQEDWEGMKETLYLLSNPANARQLLDSIADLDAGRGEEHDVIES